MIRRDCDGINTLLVKEKKAGCTNWRTKTVNTLKPTAIHQIISERECTYSGCSTMTGWADRWYHYDLLGSVTALTDDTGQVIAQYEQDAYGNVLTGATPGFNRHLTGKELDPDTGLYYFGARWYDPRTAQWIEPEPFGLDGPNLYWYAFSSPVDVWDLYGFQAQGGRYKPPGYDTGKTVGTIAWDCAYGAVLGIIDAVVGTKGGPIVSAGVLVAGTIVGVLVVDPLYDKVYDDIIYSGPGPNYIPPSPPYTGPTPYPGPPNPGPNPPTFPPGPVYRPSSPPPPPTIVPLPPPC